MPDALMILMPGFEELEAIAPLDILRRAGIRTTVAYLGPTALVEGRNQITVQAEVPLAEVSGKDYDLVVLPGGPGHTALRKSPEVLALVRRQVQAGRPVGAICASTTILHEAGVLAGHAYTGHFTIAQELPALDRQKPVVRDRLLITSQGAGTATAFGLALVEAVLGKEAADKVSAAICYFGD